MNTTNETAYAAFLRERREELLDRIADAASRSGCTSEDVTLMAVSKTVDASKMIQAYEVGYHTFGENRPQELVRKWEASQNLDDIRIDMIGNLQRNKINKVIDKAGLIHSVSSGHLAEAISMRAASRDVTAHCLLEVNVSGEETKSGMAPNQAKRVAEQVMELPNMKLEGLMTMAPAYDASAARGSFNGLRELCEELRCSTGLPLPVLSCGMSGDFEIAVEEGSTLVRLGRVVFDPSFADAVNVR